MSNTSQAVLALIVSGISGIIFVAVDTYRWKQKLKRDDLSSRLGEKDL